MVQGPRQVPERGGRFAEDSKRYRESQLPKDLEGSRTVMQIRRDAATAGNTRLPSRVPEAISMGRLPREPTTEP